MPNNVRSDPHFETHLLALSWEDYEQELRAWAAARVRVGAMPGVDQCVAIAVALVVEFSAGLQSGPTGLASILPHHHLMGGRPA